MNILSIIVFIIIMGIIIFVHELGHLLTAKMFNVYCAEFSVGMGPIVKTLYVDKDQTKYNLRLIPIGGFVMIADEMNEVELNVEKDKKLNNKPFYQQFIVLFAGTFMNMLLTYLILLFLGFNNFLKPEYGFVTTTNFFQEFIVAFQNLMNLTILFINEIGKLLTFNLDINNLSGIVGIASMTNDVLQTSWMNLIYFTGILSLNIGLMNQLPIPMLDGGRIILALYERIFRKKITKKIENILMNISLLIIGGLFLITTWNDIIKIFQ